MAYELSWQFDANRDYTSATATDYTKYNIWFLASFLMGDIGGASGAGLWTYQASCDGTTADFTAVKGSWMWGTPGTFDGTKIVQITANPGSSAHSWIVLKSPQLVDTGYVYMLISAYHGTTGGFSVHYSRQPWRANTTTTYQPLSENYMPASQTGASLLCNDASTTTRYFNSALAADGSFYVINSKSGSSNIEHGVLWAPTYGYLIGDKYPYYNLRYYSASAPGFGAIGGLGTAANTQNASRSGVDDSVGNNIIPSVNSGFVGANSKDWLSGKVWDLPMHVWFTDGSTRAHYRGRLKDFAWTPYSGSLYLAMNTTFKESAVVKYISDGVWIIPATAAFTT